MTQLASQVRAPAGAVKVVPRRHYGRWASAVVVLAIFVGIIHWAATNPGFEWGDFRHYLFSETVLDGVKNTLKLGLLAECISLVLGTILAVMRMSDNKIVSGFAFLYGWFFRGLPLIAILIFIFYCSAVLPRVGWGSFSVDSNDVFTSPFYAALLGFGLNDAGYTMEFVRSGLMSVSAGQTEAAYSLGMSPAKAMRRIILPQALRVIIPPAGNAFIGMFKLTSIAMVIGYGELMNSVQGIYSTNFNTIPMMCVACFWFLIMISALSIIQYFVERYYAKGHKRR